MGQYVIIDEVSSYRNTQWNGYTSFAMTISIDNRQQIEKGMNNFLVAIIDQT